MIRPGWDWKGPTARRSRKRVERANESSKGEQSESFVEPQRSKDRSQTSSASETRSVVRKALRAFRHLLAGEARSHGPWDRWSHAHCGTEGPACSQNASRSDHITKGRAKRGLLNDSEPWESSVSGASETVLAAILRETAKSNTIMASGFGTKSNELTKSVCDSTDSVCST